MNLPMVVTLAVLAGLLYGLVKDRPADLMFVSAVVLLAAFGVITPDDAFSGFALHAGRHSIEPLDVDHCDHLDPFDLAVPSLGALIAIIGGGFPQPDTKMWAARRINFGYDHRNEASGRSCLDAKPVFSNCRPDKR